MRRSVLFFLLFCLLPSLVLAVSRRTMPQEDLGLQIATHYGDGTCTAATLNAAISAASGDTSTVDKQILLSRVDRTGTACTWTLESNVTVPETRKLLIAAQVSINSSITLTLNGDYESLIGGDWYSGAGTVVFNRLSAGNAAAYAQHGMPFALSGCIHPTSGTTTTAAFACSAWIQRGYLVTQASSAVTYTGGNGTFWLIIHRSTTETVAGCGAGNWVRQGATRYMFCLSATQPATPGGAMLLAEVTVTAAVIAAVVDHSNRVFSSTQTFTFNITTASTATWRFLPGGMVSCDTGDTVNFRGLGQESWPDRPLFTGAGTCTFGMGTTPRLIKAKPVWWGALGDGTTNDAAALNAASVAACASGKRLELGVGTFNTASQVNFCGGLHMVGQGQRVSVIRGTGSGTTVGPLDVNDTSYRENYFANFGISHTDQTATYTGAIGLRLSHMRSAMLENLEIRFHQILLDFTTSVTAGAPGSYHNLFLNLNLTNGDTNCLRIGTSGDDIPNANQFINGDWRACDVIVLVNAGATLTFIGMDLQGAGTRWMHIHDGGVKLIGVRMENATGLAAGEGVVFGPDVSNFTIQGGSMTKGVVNMDAVPHSGRCIQGLLNNGAPIFDCPTADTMRSVFATTGNPFACLGPSENLLTNSEQIGGGNWINVGTVTLNDNTVDNPMDSAMDADELVFDTGAGTTSTRAQNSAAVASNKTFTFGAWLKGPSGGKIHWRVGAWNGSSSLEPVNGQFTFSTDWKYYWGSAPFCQASIGGCTLDGNDVVRVEFRSVVDDQDASTLHIWGAHLSEGTLPACYIRTDTLPLARSNASVFRNQVDGRTAGVVGFVKSGASGITDSDLPTDTPVRDGNMGVNLTSGAFYARNGATAWGNFWPADAQTVASATTIAINPSTTIVAITGTATIQTINTCSSTFRGKEITLEFSTILTMTHGTGNLRIGGDFVSTADDTLVLKCDGTNWRQLGRNAN